MIQISPENIAQRFMRYVQVDTQSDPVSQLHPTTEKQKDLSRMLFAELQSLGLAQVETDEYGYVYATIPASSNKKSIPAICFCAHVDTAPDCSGKDVKPILHANYQGQDIILPDDTTQIITTTKYPYLKERIGDDLPLECAAIENERFYGCHGSPTTGSRRG